MDHEQHDHLKAYGIVYLILDYQIPVDWLLNYRGGSFLIDEYSVFTEECRIRGVNFERLTRTAASLTYSEIENNNMAIVQLDKAPLVAVYSPPSAQPWDDAVTMALTYAGIPYQTIWDKQVLLGALDHFDWLHLSHEDFTGQYNKHYQKYGQTDWYRNLQQDREGLASDLGFSSLHEEKKAIASTIKSYLYNGGYLFAMCSATDTYDIALAQAGIDGVAQLYDGTPADPQLNTNLNYDACLAFENFVVYTDPMFNEHSDIDHPPSNLPVTGDGETEFFSLFEFSAKFDPKPTMLTQNHVKTIKGFRGQTSGFHRKKIKNRISILSNDLGIDENPVKYIHGTHGTGAFTFLGGHDPESYQHFIGGLPTELWDHKNSPGYRLILNNILFPAAKLKEPKT
jgi:hypothetical protein